MSTKVKGKVWKFGDLLGDVDVVPFKYVTDFAMEPKDIAKVTLTGPRGDPEFHEKVKKGDILVAKSIGWGHEHGILGLKELGIGAVVADGNGWATGFALEGIPALSGEGISEQINQGDTIELDYVTGEIQNLTTGKTIMGKAIDKFYLDILLKGGLVKVVKKMREEIDRKKKT